MYSSQQESQFSRPPGAREKRGSRLLRGRVSSPSMREQTILIRNMSSTGLGGSVVDQALPIGAEVTVTLAAAVLTGRVCWSKGKSFGIQLSQEIDLGRLSEAQKEITANPIGGDWKVRPLHRHEHQTRSQPRRIV